MEVEDHVKEGSWILLMDKGGKKWLIKAELGKKTSTHWGEISLCKMVGVPYGSAVRTHLGERLWILRPTIEDFVMKARRPTQIVYPKDLGLLVVRSGIRSGSIVVEAGTGSGALTSLLAWIVQPEGHVYSYEVKERVAKIAEKNLAKAGLEDYVTIKLRDIRKGIEEKGVDAVFLDFGEPWEAIEHVYMAMKGGGVLSVITPTYNQAERVAEALRGRFVDLETVELFLRRVEVRPGKTRPATTMIGYTALLTTARRIIPD